MERRVEISPEGLMKLSGQPGQLAAQEIMLRAGDLNGDGFVDGADLEMMREVFGSAGAETADLDGDGAVDVTDLALLGSNWGRGR